MLTGVQLMAIETQSFSPPWNMRDLFRKFPARTLSVRSIIGAVENQKIGCFVRLRYPSILQSATSFGALQASFVAGHGGLLLGSDLVATQQKVFQPHGVNLRYATSDGRALLVGTVASLASVPVVPVTARNIEDAQTGWANVGAGAGGFSAVLIAISTVPEPASPVIFLAGVILGAAASGTLFGLGLGQVIDSNSPSGQPATSSNDGGTSSTDGTDVPQPDGDSVTVPDAVVYGDIDGVNVDQVVELAAEHLADIPNGWDLGTGTGIPFFPGLGDPGDLGDGNGGFGGGLGSGLPGA